MGKYEKLKQRIMRDPFITDLTIDEIDCFLKRENFKLQSVHGSHHIYVHEDLNYILCIPTKGGRHIKPAYIKLIRDALADLQ